MLNATSQSQATPANSPSYEPNPLSPSPFQKKLLTVPEIFDMFLGGGRGGAKSFGIAWLLLKFIEKHPNERLLYIRKTYAGLQDFAQITRLVFNAAYSGQARYNSTTHVWQFPNGCTLELGQLDHISDYDKYQGRSFAVIVIDEAGQYADPFMIDLLRSNLRAATGVPTRFIIGANPGGVGHAWLAKRFVFVEGSSPWAPFIEKTSGREFVSCPSTYLDNPFINQEEYLNQLKASCPHDPELLKSWVSGDWTVARGAYFAAVLDEERNLIEAWNTKPKTTRRWNDWEFYLAHDYGSSAPSVTYCVAKSGGAEHEGQYFPKDSLVLFDELATCYPDNLNEGLRWTVPKLSNYIKEMCDTWQLDYLGVADDAIFSNFGNQLGSIADEFSAQEIVFYPAHKADRISGWTRMRTMLEDAGKPDKAGLYVSRKCSYFWQTVPYIAHDIKKREDCDSSGPDHAADAVRYGVLYEPPTVTVVRTTGTT